MKQWYQDFFIRYRFFMGLGLIALLFALSASFTLLAVLAKFLSLAFVLLCIIDIWLLYRVRDGLSAKRILPDKFSLSDPNPVQIELKNAYPSTMHLEIIDEVPVQFQKRDIRWTETIDSNQEKMYKYTLTPLKRGEYYFGTVNLMAYTVLGFFKRRYRCEGDAMVRVYPSFLQLKKFRLAAISNRLTDLGIKKIRKLGDTMEFEQIKEYVSGDDPRKINWKATARQNKLMLNQYQDEKSQHVYCLIDKGRPMKMPFEGLSLLDYSINASLVLSHVAIYKEDKAGLLTFSNKISSILPASKRSRQMHDILETLYNQRTRYKESDYELVYNILNRRLSQRSLLFLFTNFETQAAMRRQLRYLRAIAQKHMLIVIFFINTELDDLLHDQPTDVEEIYQQAIAEKLAYEKQLMVSELRSAGIHSILTRPKDLTVNSINKYLELKARGVV